MRGPNLYLGIVFSVFLPLFIACKTTGTEPETKGVPVIFDSDMAGDHDDAAALGILHALADRGEATILAMAASDRNKWTPLCMDAINTYFGYTDIPIGATKDPNAFYNESSYTGPIAKTYPRSYDWKNALDAPSAIDVYRSVLSNQPDKSVVFVSVGNLSNMSNLLKSKPDKHSSLNGTELVRKKVRHWVCMGGAFTKGVRNKREANIVMYQSAAAHAIQHWPTKITFNGYGIGTDLHTGPELKHLPEDHPIRFAYEKAQNGTLQPHTSFDLAAVLYAVRGLDGGPASDYWSVSEWGWATVNEDGTTSFNEDPDGRHRYHIEKMKPTHVARKIGEMLKRLPTKENS